MGELKATPGNWFAPNQRDIQAGDPEMPWEVATTVGHLVGGDEEQMANALLLAAAKDGYALAELVMDICGNPRGISQDGQDELYEAALQYAKKARGES